MKIFVSFVQQASLLAIVSKFIYLGGGDKSILWLSFAQQKCVFMFYYHLLSNIAFPIQ
jgi:hypothetical protein